MAAGCGKLALDTVAEDGPTGLQILCEVARAEALRRTYPSLRNAASAAGSNGMCLSPQRRDRISERAFIEFLTRRVSVYFAKVGDASAGARNQLAIKAAAGAHAAAYARGQMGSYGGASKTAVAAARAALSAASSSAAAAAVDVSDN